MKKLLFSSACLLLLITSCKKTTPDPAPAPVAATPFMTYASGTTWDYQTTDNVTTTVTPYTLTATSVDTAIGTKTYRIFNSVDANGTTEAYYNQTGNDYYEYTQLSAQQPPIDLKYLSTSAAVGTTWSQPISVTQSGVTITANIKSTILDTGFVETVNNITYNRVIRVKTEITNLATNNALVTATVESQNISACYAPKYGLIKREFALHVTAIVLGTTTPTDVINNNTTNILMHSSIQ